MRATNDEGTGSWSDSGSGTTNAAPSDDCLQDTTTTCAVDVGGSATGNIETQNDLDWFKVELEAGTRYQIDVEGADTDRGTQVSPGVGLYDVSGTNLMVSDDDSGVGLNSRVIYTPTAASTYYVQASGLSGPGLGTYTLSVIVLGANGNSEADTDFPETTSTTGRVEVGASATGNVDANGDGDWFRVDLETGKTYQIDLEGAGTTRGTLSDPTLSLYDGSGNAITNDDDSGTNRNSLLIYTATATGAHYLGARGSVTRTGTYTLSVRELETRTEEGDTDFAGSTATLGRVEVGGSATGDIENVADGDWFRVVLEKDKTYVFDLEGTETSSGTLADPVLLLRNASGRTLEADDDGGDGANSRLEYTATADGIYYLSATTPTSATSGGTYTLSVREAAATDDCPDGNNTTCEVDVGGSATGNIESATDFDRFGVDLEAGTRYQIDLEGAPTSRGTLPDPLLELISADEENVGEDESSGVGDNARIIYTADATGTYYAAAGEVDGATGTYTLSVIVLGANGNSEADTDFPDTTATTGRVEVGASATGNVATNFDGDRFRVDLEADKTYQFDLEGAPTGRGTLADPFLSVTDESNYLDDDDNSGTGLNSRITFTTTATGGGTFYLTASDPDGSNTGTYTLSVRDVTPPEDLPADTTTEGVVEVDGTAVGGDILAPVFVKRTGDDDVDGWDFDTDWFAVELEEGRTYRIDMKGAIHAAADDLTLPLPQINAIYNKYGDFLVNTFDSDESDSHYLFRVTFHAYDDGAYYIAASGESHEWGTYELTVIDITRDVGDYTNVGDDTNAQRGLKNLRAVEEKGGVRLTWQSPDGAAVTGYRIERRRAGGQDSGPQRSHGQPRDHHTLVEDTGNTETSYVDESAEQGVEYEYRVTARNESGPGESSDWVRAGPEEEPVLGDGLPGAPRNLTATPGNREVTLSWDPPDDNGNAPATRYRIEWRVDGKDYDRNDWGTAQETTYTTNDQANLANGVKYFFRVKAENDDGNSYGPYGPASGEVSATPTSGSAVDLGTPVLSDTEILHHGMVQLDWQDIEDAGWYVVQYYHLEDGEWLDLPAEGVDIAFHGSSAVVSNLHGLSWLRVGAASCAGSSEWSQIEQLFGTNASDWEGVPVPEVEEGDQTEPCPVVLGTPVLSDTEDLHHGMVQLDWQDIEDAGWYVVQYYHLEDGEWLDLPAEGVDIAFHGSSAVVSNLHGLSWLRVGAASCAGSSEWSQIEQLFGTNASDWEGVPVPEVAEGDEIEPCSEDADTPDNSPATGAVAGAQPTEPPDKPTGLEATTATHDSVTLTWNDPGDDSITGYVILRRIPGVDPEGQFSELVSNTGTDATTYTDDTVAAETRYTYRIKAINEHGVSERSRWYHINVPAAPETVEGDEQDGEGDRGGAPGKKANVSEPSGGDCPAGTTTTCEVDVGGSVTGNTAEALDRDWFKVVLEAGKRYQFDVEGDDTGRGTLADPYLWGLFDSGGSSISGVRSDDGGVGKNGRDTYTPSTGGSYYIATSSGQSTTGTYTLSVIVLGANGNSEANTDFPETTATGGRVDVGASATGNIETATDRDWFKVDLEAGNFYRIDLEGLDGGGGAQPDPYLRNIRDSSGAEISGTGNDDIVGGVSDSRVIFTPTAAGAYYLVASGFGGADDTGTYTLSVTELETRTEEGDTDFAASISTLGRVEVGGSATGEIDPVADVDWFRVVLEAGKTYVFDLEGTETNAGTLPDPYLVLNASGGKLSEDNDGGDGANSRLEYTATANGIHYLEAWTGEFAESDTGTYTLSVREAAPSSTPGFGEGVADLLSNHGQMTSTNFSTSVGTFDSAQGFATGRERNGYFLDSITLDVKTVPNTPDDVSVELWSNGSDGNPDASIATLTHATGNLATGENTFRAPPGKVLAAETKYFVVVFYSGERAFLDLQVTETASADGTSRWAVAGSRVSRGSDDNWLTRSGQYLKFNVSASAVPGQVTAEGDTDLPANATTKGVLVADGFAARGAIHRPIAGRNDEGEITGYSFDTDWFAVDLTSGRTYRIDMLGTIPTNDLTLRLPEIHAIYDADGVYLYNTTSRGASDAANSSHHLARVEFTPEDDGTYYIAASGESFEWGVYELKVIDITRDADKHPADRSTTVFVPVGTPVTGKIDFNRDVDWFQMNITFADTYTIDLEGQSTGRGSLRDPLLWGVYDADGNYISGTRNDGGGEGYNARITRSFEVGIYYVSVGAFGNYEGTYTLTVDY